MVRDLVPVLGPFRESDGSVEPAWAFDGGEDRSVCGDAEGVEAGFFAAFGAGHEDGCWRVGVEVPSPPRPAVIVGDVHKRHGRFRRTS